MTISELTILTGKPLRVSKWKGGRHKYQASIETMEAHIGSMYHGKWGSGDTPRAAVSDYCSQISNNVLTTDSGKHRYDLRGITVTTGKTLPDYDTTAY